MMGVLVFSILMGVVVALQSGGAKAVTKMTWHGAVNQQGHFLEKFIPRAIEKSSAPSYVRADGTDYSTEDIHAIRAPQGTSITPAGTTDVIILQIPQATAITPSNATGRVKWTELILKRWDSGWSKDLGQLFFRERSATYNSGSYKSVAKPSSGGQLHLLLDDVSKVDISKPNDSTITLEITCAYPRDRKHTQKFKISGVAENRTKILIP